jgi:hypothetical protein
MKEMSIEVEVGACRHLPPLDGRIQQPQNGVCFYEGIILIYQKKSKRSQSEQWELYKEQVGEII